MSVVSVRQRWAAWVMVGFLATAISAWAIGAAGNRVLEKEPNLCKTCLLGEDPCKLERKILELELKPQKSSEILRCNQPEEGCIRKWVKAQIYPDFLLIPSYSALMAFIFFLLSVPRDIEDPSAPRVWGKIGIVLAVVMLAADIAENALILQLLSTGEALPFLWLATAVKWGAVALASALAGVLALRRIRGRRRWSARWSVLGLSCLAGLVTGIVLGLGVILRSVYILRPGTNVCLPLFFLLVLIHAVGVMIKSDPQDLAPPEKAGKS